MLARNQKRRKGKRRLIGDSGTKSIQILDGRFVGLIDKGAEPELAETILAPGVESAISADGEAMGQSGAGGRPGNYSWGVAAPRLAPRARRRLARVLQNYRCPSYKGCRRSRARGYG